MSNNESELNISNGESQASNEMKHKETPAERNERVKAMCKRLGIKDTTKDHLGKATAMVFMNGANKKESE